MTADWSDRRCPRRDTSEPGARARVVAAATTLLLREGVGSLTAARVHAAAHVTQAELNGLFPDSGGIVEAIVEAQLEVVLRAQRPSLDAVHRLEDLDQWQSRLLESCAARGGCPLGSLIHHLARRDDRGRLALATAFAVWQGLLAAALSRIQAAGELDSAVAPEVLAIGVLAALQGGYLLAHTTQDADQLRASLDMALGRVRRYAT
jgi:TetR/AcrR family transcriptional repressor of nem operon